MEASVETPEGGKFLMWSVEAAIRIGLLALLVIWSLLIIRPFLEVLRRGGRGRA